MRRKQRREITKDELIKLGFTEVKEDGSVYWRGELRTPCVRRCKHERSGKDKVYPYINVYDNETYKWQKENGKIANGQRSIALNRIVYAWFHDICPADLDVDHKNDNPFDNSIDNLQLLTRLQNNRKKGASRNQYSYNLTDDEINHHKYYLSQYDNEVKRARKIFLDAKEEVNKRYIALQQCIEDCSALKENKYVIQLIKEYKREWQEAKDKMLTHSETWHYWVKKRKEYVEAFHQKCAKI